MKKIILFVFITLMVSGCSIQKFDTTSEDTIVNTILAKDINLYNRVSKGYKYYLPTGVRILDYTEYNEKLYSEGKIYYLYVDIVSYHYKKNIEYKKGINSLYYKDLEINGKKGYIDIVKRNNEYYINYYYNFAKMEAIVSNSQIKNTLKDMSYILSSIQYNDLIIDSFIGENTLNYTEEKYTIKKPKENEQTFLDYVNTYDNYKEETNDDIDNETIKNNTIDDNENTIK